MKKLYRVFFIIMYLIFTSFLFSQENITNQNNEKKLISMDFNNQTIKDILYSIAALSNTTIILDDTISGNDSISFDNVTYDKAIQILCNHCHLYFEIKEGIYYFTKVNIIEKNSLFDVETENVDIIPFLECLSRVTKTSIMYDNLPKIQISIHEKDTSVQKVLNLIQFKLQGYAVVNVGTSFYIQKISSSSKSSFQDFKIETKNEAYNLQIKKAVLSTVLEDLFKKGNKEFVNQSKSNVTLENLTYSEKGFDDLLTLVLEQSNLDFVVKDSIYYIFDVQKKDILKNYKESVLIPLKYLNAENVISLIPQELNAQVFTKVHKNTNSIVITGSNLEIREIISFISQIDVNNENCICKNYKLQNLNVKDFIGLIPSFINVFGTTIIPKKNEFVTFGTEESHLQLEDFIKRFDSENQFEIVKLNYIKTQELIAKLPPFIDKNLIVETKDESVFFFIGSDSMFKLLNCELKVIDIPVEQIRYQVLIIQNQKDKSFNWSSGANFGTNLDNSLSDWNEGWIANLTSLLNVNFDIITTLGIQAAVRLNSDLTNGKSKVLIDTTINGLSGESVHLTNSKIIQYPLTSVDQTTKVTTQYFKEISSGLDLEITGWSSGNDTVSCQIKAKLSKENSSATDSKGTSIPSTTQKEITTTVRTESGKSIIIGGLLQTETDKIVKKVPVLGQIPLVGNLFKTISYQDSESEVVIYLIPFVEKNEVVDSQFVNIKNLFESFVMEDLHE